MLYKTAHQIYVGQWVFYPELMMAQNMHNGNPVHFRQDAAGNWQARSINIPADWMFKEICEWFHKWITGATVAPAVPSPHENT